jgi:hypothetical protein
MISIKMLDCKILDKKASKLLSKGSIAITRDDSSESADGSRSYEAEIQLEDFLPSLDSKSVVLELTPDIAGTVFLHFPNVKDTSRLDSTVKVFFQDAIWSEPDWFDSL